MKIRYPVVVKLVTTKIKKSESKLLKVICPKQNKLLGKKVFLTFQNLDALLTDILYFRAFIFTHPFKYLESIKVIKIYQRDISCQY